MPMRAGPSPQDILRLKQAEETAKAATKRATELSRDLGLLKLEKAESETRAAVELAQGRLRETPCLWAGCGVVLNSGAALQRHVAQHSDIEDWVRLRF